MNRKEKIGPTNRMFLFVIPFYLQLMPEHSANCVKLIQ
jgi:hypothetical protein